jgi:DNA modification methylase
MNNNLSIVEVPISELRIPEYAFRTHTDEQASQLSESFKRFGVVDPIIINKAVGRENMVIGGRFRIDVARELGYITLPTVSVNIPDIEKEKELALRLGKNQGEFDVSLLAEFDDHLLTDVGFTSENMDQIFPVEEQPEVFDLKGELEKLDIKEVTAKTGDVYEVDGFRLMVGDSMNEADMLKLMNGNQADLCMTDPPYLLDYLHGKKKTKGTEGFGYKRDRHYIGTDTLPDDFTERWMSNVAKVQKPNFSIIIYENPKNLREIWNELEKHWKYRNTITWRLPNRMQGYAANNKFFNKTDIALVGTSGEVSLDTEPESDELLQQEYENALFAISGKPHWEPYGKGNKYCPTDFIDYIASDAKSSGQGIIFGTKPVEILIPYIKVLTKRDDIVLEPFGGSGSTGVAALKLKRRCFMMEKCPEYAHVIMKRIELLTGKKPVKI